MSTSHIGSPFEYEFKVGDATFYQGNCLDVLGQFTSDSVDLIFADPPYNLSNGGITCQSGKWVSVDKGAWDKSDGVHADHEFNRMWLSECQRVMKPSGTIWVSGTQHVAFSVGFAMKELGFHVLNTVTWFKPNASPNLSRRYLTHSTELLVWAAPERTRPLQHTFNYDEMRRENGGKQMRDVWEFPTPARWEKASGGHPTQKPLAILDRIVRLASKPGELVLDPFCGSGTSGVAAIINGRRFVGVDMEQEFLRIAERRLQASELEEASRRMLATRSRRYK